MESSRLEQEILQSPRIYRFGEFVLNAERYELRKGGMPIRLQPKTFDVLCYLVAHSGRLVDKDELFRAVWPDVIVTENSLTRCIKDLRKALDDDAAHPRYIETIARRGYRLLVAPDEIDDFSSANSGQSDGQPTKEGKPVLAPMPTVAPGKRSGRIVYGAIAAIAAIAAITGIGWRGTGPESVAAKPAIAVLSFANLSSEPETQYFADGVAEDLLDLFAQVPHLRVVARTSSFVFRGQERDIKAIGRELGVDWVLEGSVRREADNARVTVQLIDARNGFHAWSGRYDRKYTDLFAMQDEIARAVVTQVLQRVELLPQVATVAPTANFDAYQSFMIGRDYLNRRALDWPAKSLAAFDHAIALDPKFARAHAGKAIAEAAGAIAPGPGLKRARESADRALQLDPTLAFGHAARGFILLYPTEGSDPRAAEAALRRSLQLDPSQGNTYNWLYAALTRQGRRGEALQQLEKGIEVDPLNPSMLDNRATMLFWLGRFDEARAGFERALQLPGSYNGKYISMALLQLPRGELADALRSVRLFARNVSARDATLVHKIGFTAYARLGLFDEAERRFKLASTKPFDANRLPSFEEYLRMLGRVDELEPLARSIGPTTPASPPLEQLLGRAAALRGDWDLGIARLAPFVRLEPADGLGGWGGNSEFLDSQLALIHALIKKGRIDDAQAEVVRILARHRTARASGYTGTPDEQYLYAMALTLALPARDDEVFAALESALSLGWNNVGMAEHDPRWDRIRSDPRFKVAMEKAAKSMARERAKVEARVAAGDPDFIDAKP